MEQLEKDQNFLGISGVEDELQDNVKDTIMTLREAGIKIWMLTGDKLETAMCIGVSTSLKPKGFEYFLVDFTTKDLLQTQLSKFQPFNQILIVQG